MTKDNTLKIITHVLGYLTCWIGPLIILIAVEDEGVKKHARKAFNWQMSLMIYGIVSIMLFLILIGIPMFIGLMIMDLVFIIVAAIKASKDELWNYPLSIPFLK
jgi:uncharacterized protein